MTVTSVATMKCANCIRESHTALGHVTETVLASAKAISGVNCNLLIALTRLASSLSTAFTEDIGTQGACVVRQSVF